MTQPVSQLSPARWLPRQVGGPRVPQEHPSGHFITSQNPLFLSLSVLLTVAGQLLVTVLSLDFYTNRQKEEK